MKQVQKISKGIQIIICVFILILSCNSKAFAQYDITIFDVEAYCYNGSTFIDFDVDSTGTPLAQFYAGFEGNIIDTFFINTSNYTIEVPNNSLQTDNLFVIGSESCLGCFDEHLVTLPNCNCDISNFYASSSCDEDGNLDIFYNFNISGGNNSGYDLFIDGVFYDYFPNYPTSLVYIEDYPITQFDDPLVITVSDNDNPTCFAETVSSFSGIDCNATECIYDFSATFSDCYPNGTVDIELDFDYVNVQHNWFSVTWDDSLYIYDWTDLPVTFNVPAFNDTTHLLIMDGNEPACMATTPIVTPACEVLECNISNLVLSSSTCNGLYASIEVDFDYENNPSDNFVISANGTYSTFSYSDLPIDWWNLPGDGVSTYNVTIHDAIDTECLANENITVANCGAEPCSIEVSNIQVGCFGYIPYVFYDAVTEDDNSISYNLYANGILQGTYNYGTDFSFNHSLNNFSGTVLLEWIGSPGCYFATTIEIPPVCAEYCNFQITNTESYCDGSIYYVDFELNTNNVGPSGFEAFYGSESLGTFQYGEPSYTVAIPSMPYFDQFHLLDLDSMYCNATTDIEFIDCDGCGFEIYSLSVNCINGEPVLTFYVSSDEPMNAISVFIDGIFYETLDVDFGNLTNYLPLYLDLENIALGEHTIALISDNGCEFETEFIIDDICCNIEITAITTFCVDDAAFVTFEVEAENVIDSFNLEIDWIEIGNFAVGEPNYTVELLEDDAIVLSVVAIADTYCYSIENLPAYDCASENCFYNLDIEWNCDETTGNFEYTLDFEYSNFGNNGFIISGNGVSYGPFQYSDLPLTFGDLPGDGTFVPELVITDADNPDYNLFWEGNPIDCNACIFEINNFEVGCYGTIPTITYVLISDQNMNDYNVYINGDLITNVGFNNGSQQTIFLNGINNLGEYELTLEGSGNCIYESSFTITDNCSNDCELNIPFIETYCVNGTTYIDFEVDYINTNNIGFQAFLVDANAIESFEYGEPYYTIELPGDVNIFDFFIFDIGNSLCYFSVDVPQIDCIDDCQFVALNVETICNENEETFFYEVSFDPQNQGVNGFTIVGNGNDYGTFNYYDLPISFGELIGDDSFVPELVITDVDNPNCQIVWEGDPIECSNCIFEVSNFEVGCDGTIPTISYVLTSDQNMNDYNVYIDGNLITSEIFINGSPQTILVNEITNLGDYNLTIEGSGGCLYETTFNVADNCTDYCDLYIPVIESYCINNVAYADFEVQSINTNNTGFEVWIDGSLVQSFEYGLTSYTLELPTIINNYDLWIFDIGYDICNGGIVIPQVICNDDCQFVALNVETICDDSNGTFSYMVSFDPQNQGANGFIVQGNGNNYGTFSYYDLPISFGELIGDDSFVPELVITDVDNPDCSIVWEGDPIECISGGQCFISDLSINNECNDDDEVFVMLDFIAQNNTNNGFNVLINNVFIDSYQYADLPIELGPLAGDGLTPYLIEFADVDDPNCGGIIELSEISCVWAGDANFDKIVNNYDLLNIGLAYGYAGEQRVNADIDFDAEPAESWQGSFENGINHKHADCNGNGEVTMLDVTAIDQNYNFVSGKTGYSNNGSAEDPPLFIDLPEGSLVGGTELEIPIILGSMDFPVDSIYGLAFTIEYNPTIIDSTSVAVAFEDSWFAPESLQINLTKEIETGFIDAAISRIDHENISGNGEIGVMNLVLLENVEGKTTIPLQIEITNVKAIRHSENEITLNTNAESVDVVNNISSPSLPNFISIYPNPAKDFIMVKTIDPIQVSIYNAVGKQLINQNINDIQQINLHQFSTGVYLIKIENESANYFEKLIIE